MEMPVSQWKNVYGSDSENEIKDFFVFETRFCYVFQDGFGLMALFMLQPLQ